MPNKQQRPSGVIENPGVLKNARRERFAQELARGTVDAKAYELAGFKPDPKGAAPSHMKARPDVAGRLKELLAASAATIPKTVDDIVGQIHEAWRMARDMKMPGVMKECSLGTAKILGLVIDKQVNVIKSIKDMNAAELRAFLGRP